MKNFLTLACLAALTYAGMITDADAQTSDFNGPRVEIGIDVAATDWKVKATENDATSDTGTRSISDTGAAGGVSFRYTRPARRAGTRWGIQVNASWADAPLSDRIDNPSNEEGQPEAAYSLQKYKRDWTVNFMHRTSRDIGRLSPYVAFGASATRVTLTHTSHAANDDILESRSFKDSEDHFGWIIALGTDIEVSNNASMNLQVDFADYGDKTYTGDAKVKPRAANLRLGMIIKF